MATIRAAHELAGQAADPLNEQTRGLQPMKEVIKYYSTGRGALACRRRVSASCARGRPREPRMQFHMAMPATTAQSAARARARMTVVIGQCRPDSRGSIHVKSSTPGVEPRSGELLSAHIDRTPRFAGMQIAARSSRPSLEKYIAFENKPGKDVNSYDEWLDYAERPARRPITWSAPARWHDPMAVVDDRCACTASPAPGHRRLDHADRTLGIPTPYDHGSREGADMLKRMPGRRSRPRLSAGDWGQAESGF